MELAGNSTATVLLSVVLFLCPGGQLKLPDVSLKEELRRQRCFCLSAYWLRQEFVLPCTSTLRLVMLQRNNVIRHFIIDVCANSGYQALLSPEGPGYEAKW